jgi:hypothetical protein
MHVGPSKSETTLDKQHSRFFHHSRKNASRAITTKSVMRVVTD